ncbi:hypothetical protein GC105_06345 [Alkalibaculum sp. M08DMB]|uniref:Uncharacterized protein n=1 Tax=Alkalibaculum sporogenes TaxID=2655001 RepID=A0A6A7K7L4_9FIRM|nr:hypothetical protein [Alkalibaculum sporogenes]MPW25404.1 hypothetical protein [Alkalibaculum sporogenes]
MKKITLMFLCFIILLIGTSCSNKDVIEENDLNTKKINDLERKIDDLQTQIEGYKSSEEDTKLEKQFYLDFIISIIPYISDEDMIEIAQQQWTYSILVDDIPIPEDGIIEISSDSFKLSVSEEQSPYTTLPLDIHNKGKISGNLFSNHIQFLDVKPSDISGSDGTIVSLTTYTFTRLDDNSIVNLELSTELQDRLGLNTNALTIKPIELNTFEDSQDTSTVPDEDEKTKE